MCLSDGATRVRVVDLLAACLFIVTSLGWQSLAFAGGTAIVPQTKLRLAVIQWMPTKGEYQQWDALSGEFVVSQAGTVVLPVIGSVAVGDFDSEGLAAEIAKRLQEKIALVNKPGTIVEIIEYPPVYVVGDVTQPGEYRFREGLTVLQALALSGGEFRSGNGGQPPREEIKLVGELQGINTSIARIRARMARLEAEMSGSKEIRFPSLTPDSVDKRVAAGIFAQEKIILSARANELDRQTKSLAELRNLLNAEIAILEEKIKAADIGIGAMEGELAAVAALVDKGIALPSRKSELERILAGYRADRLDQITAIMRARQSITEATRNLDGLRDQQRTEIAAELQSKQADLDQLTIKREISQKLLLDILATDLNPAGIGDASSVDFTIQRKENGVPTEIPATELTVLMPADVLKVAVHSPTAPGGGDSVPTADPGSVAGKRPDELSN